MKTNRDVNLRKIITLMVALLCLATLLSLMPDHEKTSQAESAFNPSHNPQVLAQKQAYLLHQDKTAAQSLKQF